MTPTDPLDGPTATPRDIIRPAISDTIVDGSWELTERDVDAAADDALAALDRAGFAVVDRVWVAELDLCDDGGSYVAVHTTPEGAVAAIVGWAGGLGIEVDDLTTESGSETLDDHPDVRSYGITHTQIRK